MFSASCLAYLCMHRHSPGCYRHRFALSPSGLSRLFYESAHQQRPTILSAAIIRRTSLVRYTMTVVFVGMILVPLEM